MILAIDVANTNIVVGGMSEGACLFSSKMSSSRTRTEDEYAVLLRQISAQRGVDLKGVEGSIVASVVPQLTHVISEAVTMSTGKAPIVVGPGVKTGLNIRIDDPLELGADFVAAAVAALDKYSLPCVTIDMAAATALGVLDKDGRYIGGVICPGVMVAHDALKSATSQLRHVRVAAPERVIEKNTAASVQSGMIFGSAAMLDGLIDRIEQELKQTVSAVATGDWAKYIVPHCRRGITVDEDLIMRGLLMIYQRNKK